MSEIRVEIYQKVVFKEQPSLVEKPYYSQVTQAIANGWSSITSLVLFFINNWPILIVLFLVYWRWRFMRKKRMTMTNEA